jgi:hypothetical protein
MPRGSKPGERRGGRKKGTPNKITAVQRAAIQSFLDRNWKNADEMLEDVWHGIEIEKQMQDGTTVVGRLNADPKGALDIMAKFAEFAIPKLGRTEITGEDGGPVRIIKVDMDE